MPSLPLPSSYKTAKRKTNNETSKIPYRVPLSGKTNTVQEPSSRGPQAAGITNHGYTDNTGGISNSSDSNSKSHHHIPRPLLKPVPTSTPSDNNNNNKNNNNAAFLSSTTSSTSIRSNYSHSYSNNSYSHSSSHSRQFHRRQITNSSIPSLPKPSHKPPSSSNDFRGDLKSQDVFAAAFKKKNEKLRVLFPGMDRFEMERMDMWNHDSICTPCLIVQPRSNKEVSDTLTGYTYGVLKCLSANRKQNTKLAIPRLTIAGGRNSINAMRDGCIVLDMSRMRGIKVNRQNNECTIQGGVRVIDLDATLSEYGLIAVTSIFQNLGVVGSILAGGCGFSYASRKYGLACDNVLEAEVILADGRLKRCSKGRHVDLFHSLCGGGGGFGVVVSVTLKCYPLLHAALLTYDIPTSHKSEDIITRRRKILMEWAKWLHGEDVAAKNLDVASATLAAIANDDDFLKSERPNYNAVEDDVFSQLIIPTKQSSSIQFIGTSINENAIPQTDGFIELYEEQERKNKRGLLGGGSMFARLKNNHNDVINSFKQHSSPGGQYGWDKTPGLSDLIVNKFGASVRHNVQFCMVRYADQLQSHSNNYFASGNVYIATKYATSLSPRIIDILVLATLGDISPNNESKIYLHALGGQICKLNDTENVSFTARDMKYVIFIEGRWEAKTEHKYAKEREKVTKWVHWIVNLLHREDGIQSTSHPESLRDQVPKRSKPAKGWYNFDQISGAKLEETKKKRDPKNVFSLTSRVSYEHERALVFAQPTPIISQSSIQSVKDGEVDPSECLTPKNIYKPNHNETIITSLSSSDDSDETEKLCDMQDQKVYTITADGITAKTNEGNKTVNDDSDVRRNAMRISQTGSVEVMDDEFYIAGNNSDDKTEGMVETEENSVSNELKRLLSVAEEEEDDLNDWSLSELLGPVGDDSPTAAF